MFQSILDPLWCVKNRCKISSKLKNLEDLSCWLQSVGVTLTNPVDRWLSLKCDFGDGLGSAKISFWKNSAYSINLSDLR